MSFARDVATIQSVSAKLEKYLQEKKKDVEEKTALLDLKIKEKKIIDEKNLTLCMACNKYKSSKCFYVSYNINKFQIVKTR